MTTEPPCPSCSNGVVVITVYTEDGLSTRNDLARCPRCRGRG